MSNSMQYHYAEADAAHTSSYLLPQVRLLLNEHRAKRVLEIGCGNAANASALSNKYSMVGIDPSESGVRIARERYPTLRIELGSAYEDLYCRFGRFDTVLSLEVIEHLYDPRLFLQRAREILDPDGTIILSTPYHGYLKKSCAGIKRSNGRTFHSSMGWRSHKILLGKDLVGASERAGLSPHRSTALWANSLVR